MARPLGPLRWRAPLCGRVVLAILVRPTRPVPETPWAVSPANFLTTSLGRGELNHKYLTFIFFYLNLSKPAGEAIVCTHEYHLFL